MNGNKFAAMLIFAAILLATVVQICKPMQMYCGPSCAGFGAAISEVAMGDSVDMGMGAECSERVSSCATSVDASGHMAAFSDTFPSLFSVMFSFAPLLVAVVLLSILFFVGSGETQRRARISSYVRRITNVVGIDTLRFALSQGILHPKIYA